MGATYCSARRIFLAKIDISAAMILNSTLKSMKSILYTWAPEGQCHGSHGTMLDYGVWVKRARNSSDGKSVSRAPKVDSYRGVEVTARFHVHT